VAKEVKEKTPKKEKAKLTITELIEQLDDDNYNKRENAEDALVKKEKKTLKKIEEVFLSRSLEVRLRLSSVLKRLSLQKKAQEAVIKLAKRLKEKEKDILIILRLEWIIDPYPEILVWLKRLSKRKFGNWTLKELKSTNDLDLSKTTIVDVDLKYIGSLTSLTSLSFWNTKITGRGFDELSTLTSLTVLNLEYTKITNQSLKELSALTSLTELYLSDTKITDAGLKELSTVTSLTELSLVNTKITDKGLKELKKLTSLTKLYLRGTKITVKGVEELQKALPKCEINHDAK